MATAEPFLGPAKRAGGSTPDSAERPSSGATADDDPWQSPSSGTHDEVPF